jgi:polyisoprenyl-teichoic acid--peptidoglycan teichoic acid transferase
MEGRRGWQAWKFEYHLLYTCLAPDGILDIHHIGHDCRVHSCPAIDIVLDLNCPARHPTPFCESDPDPLSNLQTHAEFSSGIRTNLSFEDLLKLGMLAKDIPIEGIRQGVIDSSMAVPANTTINGVPASVLRPVPDLIRILRDEIFVPAGPLSPLTLMQADPARVRIIKNTYSAGLEERTARFLTDQGMQVVEYGAPTDATSITRVILYSSKLYALRYLTETFGMGSHQIVIQPDPEATVDIEIRLGKDWAGRLPVGY